MIATLLAVITIFSIWANRQAFNTDNWVNTSDRVLQDPDVREQLSAYLANQLFANADVQGELESALPPRLQPLAGPAAGGLQQLAPQIAEKALATSQAEELWRDANRAAHESLLKLLDGGGEALSTEGGEVTLDLGTVLTEVGGRLGIGSAISSKLPADAGRLTILKSDQISTAQDASQVIRGLPVVLTLLLLLLYGLAIYLAGPRRRRTLRSVGFSLIFAGVVALLLRGLVGGEVVGALAKTESAEPAVEAVWEIGTSLLVTVAASAIAFGVLVFLGAWLAGPTQLARGVRMEAAPHLREQPVAAGLVAFAVFIALIAWAPIAAFQKPIGILLFALLFAAGAEVLRRQTLREFPAGSSGSRPEWLRSRRQPAASVAGSPAPTKVDELERLGALRRNGDLSDAEFEAAKKEILAASTDVAPG